MQAEECGHGKQSHCYLTVARAAAEPCDSSQLLYNNHNMATTILSIALLHCSVTGKHSITRLGKPQYQG